MFNSILRREITAVFKCRAVRNNVCKITVSGYTITCSHFKIFVQKIFNLELVWSQVSESYQVIREHRTDLMTNDSQFTEVKMC